MLQLSHYMWLLQHDFSKTPDYRLPALSPELPSRGKIVLTTIEQFQRRETI